jgi:DNA-binding CsgD family transcriptional regulator
MAVPWEQASADPAGQLAETASEVAALLQDLARCSAFSLGAWDPTSNSHRHQTLASDGYSESTLAHVDDGYVKDNRAFAIAHLQEPRGVRWRDLIRDWKFEFPETYTAQEHLIPSGFKEGFTMCLRLPDGRYTGAFHMSWTTPAGASDERRETAVRFRPLLASICDQLRAPRLLAEAMALSANALIVSSDGKAFSLPNHAPGPHLSEGGALRELILRKRLASFPRRFLWADEAGLCHRVTITACHGDVSLVVKEQVPWPYALSFRELQVLHLVASGASNSEIAQQLFISTRTASTHIEHILAKMGGFSRAKLAAMAAEEGLLLAEFPSRRTY